MPLKKEIKRNESDIATSFHRVETVSVDLLRKTASIGLGCYADQADYIDDNEPVSRVHLMLFGVAPEKGQDIVDFAESVLVAHPPADYNHAADVLIPAFGIARYAFAGAEIVD